jgi:DNA-binding MarR family transcriptional regulator
MAPPSRSLPPSLIEARELALLLMTVAERMRAHFEGSAAMLELTPPQARALLELGEPTPMRALADALRCDASNVTGLADRLEALGLATREADPLDRRVKLLVLTEAGKHRRADLLRRVTEESPVMSRLDTEERRQLRGLLARLAVGAASGPPCAGET